MEDNNNNNNNNTNIKKEPGRLQKVFGEAMTYFGPGMIAALGTKDPNEIYKAYIQGMTAKQKDEELELSRQSKIEQSRAMILKQMQPSYDLGFVDKVSGNVVKTDKRTGRAFTLDGKEIPANNVVHEETYRQIHNLDRRDKSLEIAQQGLDLKTLKESQLTDAQIKQHASFKHVIKSIEEIKRLQPGVTTGPAIGRLQQLAAVFGKAPTEFVELQSMTASVLANYGKAVSGTQVNKEERRLFLNVIPRVTDTEEDFMAKTMQFEKMVKLGGVEFLNAIQTGQPLRQELALKLLNNIDRDVVVSQKIKDDSEFSAMLDKVIQSKMEQNMKGGM